jgi:uncharacterized damage-inducible protein DinB
MTTDEFYDVVMEAYRPAKKLISMVPTDKLDWKPGPGFMNTAQVICHLSDGMAGVLTRLTSGNWPSMEQMEAGMRLENLPSCSVQEALEKLEKDSTALRAVLNGVSEQDFTSKVVAVPWGMKSKMERMAIAFLEHFTNHKMQLFTYLKLLGLPVDTGTLYMG